MTTGFRTIGLTVLALTAFAANSILCRVALREGAIDPATFSTVRVVAGAVTLLLIAAGAGERHTRTPASWVSAGWLALYALPFAFAYARLSAGTGALILFGCVQTTMLIAAVHEGERLRLAQTFGLAASLGGLVYLMLPGLTAPPWLGALLMAVAGVSWGVYSLRGRGVRHPLAQTTTNFVRAVPLVLLGSIVAWRQFHVETIGVALAVASGALASGVGYVIWYAALRGLTAARAAVVQLAVPVLAAAGGVVFLQETISSRLVVSTVMILGGIGLAIAGRERFRPARAASSEVTAEASETTSA